jgi:hypothetical protein
MVLPQHRKGIAQLMSPGNPRAISEYQQSQTVMVTTDPSTPSKLAILPFAMARRSSDGFVANWNV